MAKYHDIQNLRTRLFIANIQAVRQIIAGITFFSCYFFLISNDWKYAKEFLISSQDFFLDNLVAAGMHLNSMKEICPEQSFIPFFVSFNTTNEEKSSDNKKKSAGNNKTGKPEHKLSANTEKLAGNNKENKPKNKSTANREELVNNNGENLDNKPRTDMKS